MFSSYWSPSVRDFVIWIYMRMTVTIKLFVLRSYGGLRDAKHSSLNNIDANSLPTQTSRAIINYLLYFHRTNWTEHVFRFLFYISSTYWTRAPCPFYPCCCTPWLWALHILPLHEKLNIIIVMSGRYNVHVPFSCKECFPVKCRSIRKKVPPDAPYWKAVITLKRLNSAVDIIVPHSPRNREYDFCLEVRTIPLFFLTYHS